MTLILSVLGISGGSSSASVDWSKSTHAAAAGTGSDWPAYLDDISHSSFNSGARAITSGTMPSLHALWQWSPPLGAGGPTELASPVVSDGVIYAALVDGNLYAVDESTREVLWSRFLGLQGSTTCPGQAGIDATPAVAVDPGTGLRTVYENAPDGYLYALDALTGAVRWRAVVGIPSTTVNNYYAWSSPTVAGGHVYVGVSSRCDYPLVRGGVLSFDQRTGARESSWWTEPGKLVGGSIWSSVAVTSRGDVVVTTGNSAGRVQVPDGESVVLLSPSLRRIQSWEIPRRAQVTDSDFGGSPTLFRARLRGHATAMVGACNKNGIYYAFRLADLDAGPTWQTRIGDPASGVAECDAAAIWNGTDLIEGGGTSVRIGAKSYPGSVQELNPATGRPIWRTGLPGSVVGSPSEDGGGVVAVPVFTSSSDAAGVYLVSAASGRVLGVLSFVQYQGAFAQPVFAGSELVVAGSTVPLTGYGVSGSHLAGTLSLVPGSVATGRASTVKITAGTALAAPVSVFISGASVRVVSAGLDSPNVVQVTVNVGPTALPRPRDVTIVESDGAWASCTACLVVT